MQETIQKANYLNGFPAIQTVNYKTCENVSKLIFKT